MNIRKDLKPTDDIQEQIRIGKAIAEGYDQAQLDFVKQEIYKTKEWVGGVSQEDMVYISIYDYWVYGFRPDQRLYYHLLGKSHAEKREYMSMMESWVYYARLNRKSDMHLLDNKFEAYELLKPYYKREIIQIDNLDDYPLFEEFAKRHPKFVLKPIGLHDTFGVSLVDTLQYSNLKQVFEVIMNVNNEHINDPYCLWCEHEGAVLEEIIEQSPDFGIMSPKSLNGVRVPTIRVNGDIQLYGCWLKMGVSNNLIVGESRDAIMAGVNPNTGLVETDGFYENGERTVNHPVSNIPLKGFQIPRWDELIPFIKQAASELPSTVNYVSWDVVLTPKGWTIIEGNYYGMSLWQIVYERGMKKEFGDIIGWHMDDDKFWWQYNIRKVEKSAGLE